MGSLPTPPSYFLPEESKAARDVRIYHVHPPFTPLPPPPPPLMLSPGGSCTVSPPSPPLPKFVGHEVDLCRSPGLTTCPFCQARVTTHVTYSIGTCAWLMCFLFVLCGLVLGCCLIPFFIRHFKDTCHTCPRCCRVIHIHKKTCCR